MKLSIIIPVYNVEKYVRKCVQSVIEQNDTLLNEFEVVIVNDGTKDNSVEKIQDLIETYNNIRLINQDNQGLSMARNNGMSVAQGDYVWFVDSDDWISPNSFKTLLPYLDGKNDMVCMGAVEVWNDKENPYHIYFSQPRTMNGSETFIQGCAQQCTSVLAVYRRNFLVQNKISFMPCVYHEDNDFCPKVSYMSKQTTFIPSLLYFIRRATSDGRQSITTTVNPKRAFDMLKVIDSLLDFKENYIKEADVCRVIDDFISQGVNAALGVISKCDDSQVGKFNSEYYSRKFLYNGCMSRCKMKYKIEVIFFNLFPHHVVQTYRAMSHLIH